MTLPLALRTLWPSRTSHETQTPAGERSPPFIRALRHGVAAASPQTCAVLQYIADPMWTPNRTHCSTMQNPLAHIATSSRRSGVRAQAGRRH